MANPSKRKGDEGEREAVAYLIETAPDHLLTPKPMRALGAGRKDDEGDLRVLIDASLQAKNWALATIGPALRDAAVHSVTQAANAGNTHAAGIVRYPGARTGTVRWLASWLPDNPAWSQDVEPIEFKSISKALAWVRDDIGPYGYLVRPRTDRIACLTYPNTQVLVAPFEAWLHRYAIALEKSRIVAA